MGSAVSKLLSVKETMKGIKFHNKKVRRGFIKNMRAETRDSGGQRRRRGEKKRGGVSFQAGGREGGREGGARLMVRGLKIELVSVAGPDSLLQITSRSPTRETRQPR